MKKFDSLIISACHKTSALHTAHRIIFDLIMTIVWMLLVMLCTAPFYPEYINVCGGISFGFILAFDLADNALKNNPNHYLYCELTLIPGVTLFLVMAVGVLNIMLQLY